MDAPQKEQEMLVDEIKISTVDGKCCVDCRTTKTPLWRSGPAGPKSLCNACGIRYRKKRTATTTALGLNKEQGKKKDCKKSSKKKTGKDGKLSENLRRRLMALGKEVVLLQRQRSPMNRQRKLGEVEQAAVLLMAMSCGSVFA